MTDSTIKLLLIDDDEDDYILTRELLDDIETLKFNVDWRATYEEGLDQMRHNSHDVYLIDYRLGAHDGLELLKQAITEGNSKPIIMLTGKGDYRIDVEAMKAGAADYLIKGSIDPANLERSIRYAVERSRALQALHENEQKYRSLFEQSIDAIYLSDEEGRIIDANDSFLQLFENKKSDLGNIMLSSLFQKDSDYEHFHKSIAQNGEIKDFSIKLYSKTGRSLDCLISSKGQFNGDAFLNFQGVIHDVTEKKKAEQDLMNAEKLAFTGRMASSIAHEIRNPLTNVNLAVENLKLDIEGEEFKPYINIIERNSKRINQLISELLDSAKPADLSMVEYAVNDLIDETLEEAIDRIELKKILLDKNYLQEEVKIKIDVAQTKRALLNIIINSIEAMPTENGILKVSTDRSNGECVIKIKDNGTGISEENIKKLFDPFFSGKKGGVGLGLTTTQSIIASHRGRIEVESSLGEGTTFSIFFKISS